MMQKPVGPPNRLIREGKQPSPPPDSGKAFMSAPRYYRRRLTNRHLAIAFALGAAIGILIGGLMR